MVYSYQERFYLGENCFFPLGVGSHLRRTLDQRKVGSVNTAMPQGWNELPGIIMSSFVAIKLDTFGVQQTPFRPPIRNYLKRFSIT